MVERITSRTNPLMTHIRKLVSSRSYREKTGEFLGDGIKLLAEALTWQAAVTTVVYTPDAVLPELPEGIRRVEVPRDVMKSISPMEAPQGALFLAKRPEGGLPRELTGRRYLVLEGVQDPGNVGTILRTADAFGADGLILLEGCADLYNPKVVQATMGALARVRVHYVDLVEFLPRIGTPIYGTFLDGQNIYGQSLTPTGIIVMGNEGNGISPEVRKLVTHSLFLPSYPPGRITSESLNVAIATAVVCAEFRRR